MAKARETGSDHKTQGEMQVKNMKKTLNQWSEDRMRGAIAEYQKIVENGGVPKLRLLAGAWNVPKSTLQRRVKGDGHAHHAIGRKPLISCADEEELASLIVLLAQRGFPMRMYDVQVLAYQFAKSKGISGFSDETGKAGYKWFQGFLRRHRHLRITKPEASSFKRAAMFNHPIVYGWFEQYQEMLQKLGLENVPSHIWNCNETGLQDHFLSTKVVSGAGLPCFEVTAEEKGETLTCLACINAAGGYGPTLIIFKGKHMKADWVLGAPENTYLRMSDNGEINTDLFTEWGKWFIQNLPSDDPRPHLLLVDGHSSHVYNVEFLKMMRENNVYIFFLPSYTTHHLQPAEKALFKSLKHHWKNVGLESGGKRLDRAMFMPLFSKAWKEAATPKNVCAGFCGSGVFPFNPAKIKESLFMPSETTEPLLGDNLVRQDDKTLSHEGSGDGESSNGSLHQEMGDLQRQTSVPSVSSPPHTLQHSPLQGGV